MALRRQWNDTEKRPVFHLPCHGHRKINSEYLFNYIASGIRHWHSFNPVIHCIRRISLVFTDVNADDVHPINELTGINPRTMPDFVSTGRLCLLVGNMPVPERSNTLFFVCSHLELTIAPETNDLYGNYALGLDRISDAVGPCYYTRGEEDNERATPWLSSLDDQYHCFYYFNTYFFE